TTRIERWAPHIAVKPTDRGMERLGSLRRSQQLRRGEVERRDIVVTLRQGYGMGSVATPDVEDPGARRQARDRDEKVDFRLRELSVGWTGERRIVLREDLLVPGPPRPRLPCNALLQFCGSDPLPLQLQRRQSRLGL